MVEQKEKYKIIVMLILLAGACIITYYFHAILETGMVFTHFFYIPIILAALWWRRKGLVVAIFLAALIIFSHIFVRAEVVTANDYLRAIMFIVIAFVVATLSEWIAKAQAKATHLNLILRSIRNVNQLIVVEKDRDRLLKGACEKLTETRGYHNAWIALLDEAEMLVATSEAGLGEDFLPMVERLKRGELPDCGQKALREPGIVVTHDPLSTCTDCPLAEKYGGRWAMTVRLEHGEKLYGLLSVSIPGEVTADEEEQNLLTEVANDLVFALHSIELEEERKRAEETLQRLSEELELKVEERTKDLAKERDYIRHLIESSPDSQMTLDKDGKIIYVNVAFEKIVGKGREELIGSSIYEYLPKEETGKAIAEIFKKGTVRNIELTFNIPGKEAFICNFSGTVFTTPEEELGIYVTGRDITEKRRMDEALRRSEKRFRDVAENAFEWIWEVDANGKYTYASPVAEKILGYKPGELLKKHFYDLFHPEDREELKKAAFEVFAKKQPYREFLNRNVHKNGRTVLLSTSGVPVLDDEGNLLGYRGADVDITERKRAAEMLRESHEKLKELDKMKTDFLSVAYHEMRSPLAPIVGYVSLLEQGELNETQKKYVNIIEESASQLDELIESLLEVTRIETEKAELILQTVSIPELVKTVLERVKPQADAKRQTISAVVPEGTEVEGDEQKITAIFDNLILNAIKYTGEKSRVDVVVEDRKKEGDILACVADTGVGIPEEHLLRVFERFYMVDTSLTRKGGLGLGLTIVKGYVKLHGGKVWVTSEPGKGSKFCFTLPKRRN